MADNAKIRQPTLEEKIELASYISEKGHFYDVEDALACVEESMVAVCDTYCTDCIGYSGKVISVVWSGSPTFFNVYCWDKDGKMYEEEHD